MKRILSSLLILLTVFSLVIGIAACGNTGPKDVSPKDNEDVGGDVSTGEKQHRVAFMLRTQQLDFYSFMAAAAKKRAEELGITLDVYDAQGELTQSDADFEQVISLGYDLIITDGEESLITSILEANKAEIPVINVDMLLDEAEFIARITSDNTGMGVRLGEFAIEHLEEKFGEPKGTVYYLVSPGSPIQSVRADGFLSVMENYPNIELKELILESYLPEPTQRQVDDLLIREKKGNIDMIMGANSGGSLGALASVTSAGRNEIAVIGIDDEEGQLMALQDSANPYLATMAQSSTAIGKISVDAANDYLVNGTITGDVQVPCEFVTKDTVMDYIKATDDEKKSLESYLTN